MLGVLFLHVNSLRWPDERQATLYRKERMRALHSRLNRYNIEDLFL